MTELGRQQINRLFGETIANEFGSSGLNSLRGQPFG